MLHCAVCLLCTGLSWDSNGVLQSCSLSPAACRFGLYAAGGRRAPGKGMHGMPMVVFTVDRSHNAAVPCVEGQLSPLAYEYVLQNGMQRDTCSS
jgi:hypothetical protein